MSFRIEEVVSFPDSYTPEVLYWSKEFEMCAHLCACGCGDVIQLPVDPLNFSIRETPDGPTLRPSVGNWGVCDAHYFITAGKVEWLSKWSSEQIAAGRAAEDARREDYYNQRPSWLQRVANFVARVWRSLWN